MGPGSPKIWLLVRHQVRLEESLPLEDHIPAPLRFFRRHDHERRDDLLVGSG